MTNLAQWIRGGLATFLLVVSAPAHAQEPAAPGLFLQGQFIVATPNLGDPRFARSVIYMLEHDQQGAVGLIVNRIYGQGSMDNLLEGFGIESTGNDREVRLHFGGPVDPDRVFILHSPDYSLPSTISIDKGISMTSRREVFQAIADGHGPEQVLVILGYAGWASGQLENEINRGDWLSAPADDTTIFDQDIDGKWDRVTGRAGLKL
jgi:putative transcriptional regulator